MEKNIPFLNIIAHGVHQFYLKIILNLSAEYELIPGKNEVLKTINKNANIRRLRIAVKKHKNQGIQPSPTPLNLQYPLLGGNGHSVHVIVELFELEGPDYIIENPKFDIFFDFPEFHKVESSEELDAYMRNLAKDEENYQIAENCIKELQEIVIEKRDLYDRRHQLLNGHKESGKAISLQDIKVVKRLISSTSVTYQSVDPNRCEPSEEPPIKESPTS